jgi:hydrogenase 3 maturation protease
LILGVGSPLRQDDQLGLIVCDELSKNGVFCVKCEYGVENCLDEIMKYKPRNLIVVDAVSYRNGKPGEIVLVGEESLDTVASLISSHYISFKYIVDILKNMELVEKVFVIGVYPKILGIGLELSSEVESAIVELTHRIKNCVMKIGEAEKKA